MKRKVLALVFGVVIVGLFFINQYIKVTHHMNVFQFYFDKQTLTQEDRDFLQAHGPIVYGSDNNSPPLRYVEPGTDQYKGIVIDYLRALSIELGTEIVFQPMVWQDALEALKVGQIDICDMYATKSRAEIYLFSDPVYYQRGVILVKAGDTRVKSVADLKGLKVAIQRGDYAYEFIKNHVNDLDVVFTNDYEENMGLMISGQVDALVGDEPVISYFLGLNDITEQFDIVDEPLYELPSVFSLPKSEKRLQLLINKGIFALNQKNTINKIQQKWFGISTPIGSDNSLQKLTLVIAGLILLILFAISVVLLWNFELKKAVDERTKALEISRDNLQIIIDGLHHMIVVVDEDQNVISSNRLFRQLFKTESEIHRLPQLDDYFTQMSEDQLHKILTSSEGSEWTIKGRTYMMSPIAIRYDETPGLSTLLLIEDITNRKVSEAHMLQDNKMAAVGQLATGVAHEIRNPLGLIRNYAFLLRKKGPDPVLLNQSLDVIEESVDKASSIIDNLLNFSRLSDEKVHTIPLKAFIENVIELNDKLMNRSGVTCQLVLEEVVITTKEESLKHILINLINNAIDAISSTGRLTLWLFKESDLVHIHVIDTGSGMTPETKEKMFDPFYTTKKVGEGTGLGMYIVYTELAKMNGQLTVHSKEGRGTIFKIILSDLKEGHHA